MAQRFEFKYGGYLFVWARPVSRDWSHYDGSLMKHGDNELRPVMVRGHEDGQNVRVAGSPFAHRMEEFEFGEVITVYEE